MKKLTALCLFFMCQLSFLTYQKSVTPAYSINYIMGKFDPKNQEGFVKIDKKYADRDSLYLRQETYEAYLRMHWAAQKDGISIVIVSATRNFEYQKGIWELKWKNLSSIKDPSVRARKIMEYSAMPGTSRHHWGTDIDLTSVSSKYFDTPEGQKLYAWLIKNAPRFGFCQPYTQGRTTGYKEEKWHWTYLPLSKNFTAVAGKKGEANNYCCCYKQ